MGNTVLSIAALCIVFAAGSSCGEFGRVNQGQVVRYQRDQGLITLIGDSNFRNPDQPRYDVLPAVTIRVPADPKEMGPEPDAGRLLRLEWATGTAVVFDAATQSLQRIPFTVVQQRDGIGRTDPLVAGKRFPMVDRAARTVTVYAPRERKWAVLSVDAGYLDAPGDTWAFGDEVRYYYKDPQRSLRMMNVTRTDLNSAGK